MCSVKVVFSCSWIKHLAVSWLLILKLTKLAVIRVTKHSLSLRLRNTQPSISIITSIFICSKLILLPLFQLQATEARRCSLGRGVGQQWLPLSCSASASVANSGLAPWVWEVRRKRGRNTLGLMEVSDRLVPYLGLSWVHQRSLSSWEIESTPLVTSSPLVPGPLVVQSNRDRSSSRAGLFQKILFLIGGWLLYSIVMVSAIQWFHAILWHTYTYIPSLLNLPPTCLPISPTPGCHRELTLGFLYHTTNFHWPSPLYMVMYMFQHYSFKSSHLLCLTLCPKVCSLCVDLLCFL